MHCIHKERERERERDYVPGTMASIHGSVEAEGGCVVVSWAPVKWTSVDLAASHSEWRVIFAIVNRKGWNGKTDKYQHNLTW